MASAVRTVISDIVGTFSDYFRIGKSGIRLKNNSAVFEVKNAGDSAYANMKAGIYYDGSGNQVLVLASADIAGLAAGDVFYYNGTTLKRLSASGNALKYLRMNSGATAPEWVTSTDDPNAIQVVKVALTTSASQTIVTLPGSSAVVRIAILITTVYSGGATMSIASDIPTTYLDTGRIDPQTLGQYETSEIFASEGGGVVTVTVGGSPAAGVGSAWVFHTVPS